MEQERSKVRNRLSVVLHGSTACNNAERLPAELCAIRTVPVQSDRKALYEALHNANVLIGPELDVDIAHRAPRLRLVHAIGAGVDQMDVAALPPGCALCNVYEHEVPIAEYVMGVVLHWALDLAGHDRLLRMGRWDGSGRSDGAPHQELAGKRIGLIGFGHIGRAVARRAQAFDMEVWAIRRRLRDVREDAGKAHPAIHWMGGPDRLHEMLKAVDYVVVACALTEETRNMLGHAELECMRPDAYLINVARAEVIDEDALFDALKARRFAGAALDVWYRYPASAAEATLPAGRPFHTLDNVIMTPHMSAWTEPMIARRWEVIAENLRRLAKGLPLRNVVAVGETGG